MGKVNLSFEQRRKELLVRMSAQAGKQKVIKKVIPFRNDDVPNFLRELDEFEEKSRQVDLVVR